jgi:raffinose/stachyose/melibiose transport system substrate-binding protein
MKRFPWATTFGLALLAAVFLFATARVLRRAAPAGADGGVVVRFVHTNLQAGLREAFDALARDYERLHPGVTIEQIAVPERLYAMWLETKLNADLAPDIVQMRNLSNERTLRHFVPLGPFVDQPNPYNEGTVHAGAPWRETFPEGLATEPAFSSNLLNVFGVPYALATVRLVYNRALLTEIVGQDRPPQTWDELLALARAVEAHARARRLVLHPIAGSTASLDHLLNAAWGHQTQRFALERVAQPHRLESHGADLQGAFLRGQWDFTHPAVRSGLELAREISQLAQPGFLQMTPPDAQFLFLQRRALFLSASSADLPSLRVQAEFPIGALRLPWPDRDHPVYGEFVLGPTNEGSTSGTMLFGLTRASAHPEVALDFLRYLTSLPGAQRFADLSGWLPAVLEVDPQPDLRPFRPSLEGYRPGPSLNAGSDTLQLLRSALHRLAQPDGSVDDFIALFAPEYRRAATADLRRMTRGIVNNSVIYDTVFGALWEIDQRDPDPTGARARRLSEIAESQTFQEEASYLRMLQGGFAP